jgi:uncharacterized membrane protein YeaQ/YmgE (transglycosylase-associated protein family)
LNIGGKIMDNFVNKNTSEVQENVIAGIVGALLFPWLRPLIKSGV